MTTATHEAPTQVNPVIPAEQISNILEATHTLETLPTSFDDLRNASRTHFEELNVPAPEKNLGVYSNMVQLAIKGVKAGVPAEDVNKALFNSSKHELSQNAINRLKNLPDADHKDKAAVKAQIEEDKAETVRFIESEAPAADTQDGASQSNKKTIRERVTAGKNRVSLTFNTTRTHFRETSRLKQELKNPSLTGAERNTKLTQYETQRRLFTTSALKSIGAITLIETVAEGFATGHTNILRAAGLATVATGTAIVYEKYKTRKNSDSTTETPDEAAELEAFTEKWNTAKAEYVSQNPDEDADAIEAKMQADFEQLVAEQNSSIRQRFAGGLAKARENGYGVYAGARLTGLVSAFGNTIQKAESKGFVEKKLSDKRYAELIAELPEEYNNLIELSENEDASEEDRLAAIARIEEIELGIIEENGKNRLTTKGKVVAVVGGAAVLAAGIYLNKNGFALPGSKGNNSDAQQHAQGRGSKSGSGITEHVTPKNGSNKPKVGSQEWFDNLNPQQQKKMEVFSDGISKIKEIHPETKTDPAKLNMWVEKTLKLAAKKDELLGDTKGQARIDRGRLLDEQFRRYVEAAESAK